jgi:hypothetical protein
MLADCESEHLLVVLAKRTTTCRCNCMREAAYMQYTVLVVVV